MRSREFFAVALLVLAAGGCSTVTDDSVVVAIATLAPSLSDSDLDTQAVEVGVFLDQGTIQNVHFEQVTILDLTFDEFESDMLFGETDCQFFQAWNTPVLALGKCASGVIVDGDEQNHTMTLEVEIPRMFVQRTPPLVLFPSDDYDADGVDNADDNCLLVDNPDQTDTGRKGYGDACAVFDFSIGVPRLDSDADAVPDSTDNCPYVRNPLQEDSGITIGSITVQDGIGDACITETAEVTVVGTLSLGPLTEALPLRRVRWLTVDIHDQASLTDCWDDFRCELTASSVELCLDETGGAGCS